MQEFSKRNIGIKPTLIILAGGKNSRIGTDKALLKFNNKPFVQILYDNLKDICSDVIISSNNPEIVIPGTKTVSDTIKNIGPAGGIYSALSVSRTLKNFIVTVDTPFVSRGLFEFLLKNDLGKNDILIISENQKLHPLIGIYSKSVSEIFYKEINKTNYKIRNIIKKTRHKIITISEEGFYHSRLLQNINTKEDYNSVLKYLNT